jgi:hypothetical protein
MRQIARQAAAPDVDLGIDDLHRVLSSRGVPSASGAVPARRLQGPSVGETVLHDQRQRLPPAQPRDVRQKSAVHDQPVGPRAGLHGAPVACVPAPLACFTPGRVNTVVGARL